MTQNTCSGCPVQQGAHKPVGAVHLIAEPAAQAVEHDRAAFESLSKFMGCEWSLDWDAAGFYSDVKADNAFTWFQHGYQRAPKGTCMPAALRATPPAPAAVAVPAAVLAHLDGLLDDAAAHIYPSDLRKFQKGEHTATVASVRMGNRDEKSVPLFSREQVAEALAATPAAQAQSEKAIEGWKQHTEYLEQSRNHWRDRVQAIHDHKNSDCWYWQGDGADNLDSIVDSLPVAIRADQLRALAAPQAQDVQDAGEHNEIDEIDEIDEFERMDAPSKWKAIATLPCDIEFAGDFIWLYDQGDDTFEGPVKPDLSYKNSCWTHWAYAKPPSVSAIAASAAKGGAN